MTMVVLDFVLPSAFSVAWLHLSNTLINGTWNLYGDARAWMVTLVSSWDIFVFATVRAFVYVGVYGFGYMEAGKSVFQLFKNRGWEAIIADDLVGNALGLVSLIVGGIMGVVSMLFVKWFDDAGSDDKVVGFFIGFLIGLAICSILLSTVASGVNTVIVMFADAPADLQSNHPEISQKMRQIWSSIYPGSV
jgi:hypothetical protein